MLVDVVLQTDKNSFKKSFSVGIKHQTKKKI